MKRRISRETAAAFGDAPDRDVEAEFGALAKVEVNAPKVSVQAPTLSAPKPAIAIAAPKAIIQTPAPKASAVKVAAAVKAAAPKATTPVKPAPAAKPVAPAPIKLPAPAKASVATTAQTGNFIEATGKALAAPVVKAPALTAAQQAAKDKALAVTAQTRVQQAAQATASANAPYLAQRAADRKTDAAIHDYLMANDSGYAANERAIAKAGTDWLPFIMAAKVLGTGAAIIASGGAAAGAVGLTTGGAALASAAAADRLVAAVEKGGEIAGKAKGVVNDIKAAAAKGDATAKAAIATIESVSKERVVNLVPKGVEQALTGAAKDAANLVVDKLTGAGGAGLAAAVANGSLPPSSSSFALSAPILSSRKDVKASGSSASAAAARLLEAPRPVWLVSEAGKVVDLTSTPSAASSRGYVVFSSGKVVHQ